MDSASLWFADQNSKENRKSFPTVPFSNISYMSDFKFQRALAKLDQTFSQINELIIGNDLNFQFYQVGVLLRVNSFYSPSRNCKVPRFVSKYVKVLQMIP